MDATCFLVSIVGSAHLTQSKVSQSSKKLNIAEHSENKCWKTGFEYSKTYFFENPSNVVVLKTNVCVEKKIVSIFENGIFLRNNQCTCLKKQMSIWCVPENMLS